jgi:hypothetical protein
METLNYYLGLIAFISVLLVLGYVSSQLLNLKD